MIYLIARIFVYLLFALGVGAAAGWLWRNLQAASREGTLERQLMDSRSRLPQLETTLRAREERLEAVLAELGARDEALASQDAIAAERDRLAAEIERLRAVLDQRSTAPAVGDATDVEDDDELSLHPGDPAAAVAADVDADGGEVSAPPEPAADDAERTALEQALAEARDALEQANRALRAEQRRVEELTRERALQSLSLRALEQQLEIAREDQRRIANG